MRYLTHAIIFLGLWFPALAFSQSGISISNVSGYQVSEYYRLNADLDYVLSDKVIDALQHGVSLNFVITISIYQKRQWLWDKPIADKYLHYQLDYHPLSERYLVINTTSGSSEDFFSLQAALRYLGTIRAQTIIATTQLQDEQDYYLLFHAKLDVESLPGPLQPLVLFSTDWHMSSPHKTIPFADMPVETIKKTS